MAFYFEPSSDIVELVEEMLLEYHEYLRDARIGIVMVDEAPVASDGKETWGKAKKVSDADKVLMPFDFILTFSADVWDRITERQRRALVDHELCHCDLGSGKPTIKTHDIEEFAVIIERWGFWRHDLTRAKQAFQRRLDIESTGSVTGVGAASLMRRHPDLFSDAVKEKVNEIVDAEAEPEEDDSVLNEPEPTADETPAKRKRGRPRKVQPEPTPEPDAQERDVLDQVGDIFDAEPPIDADPV